MKAQTVIHNVIISLTKQSQISLAWNSATKQRGNNGVTKETTYS